MRLLPVLIWIATLAPAAHADTAADTARALDEASRSAATSATPAQTREAERSAGEAMKNEALRRESDKAFAGMVITPTAPPALPASATTERLDLDALMKRHAQLAQGGKPSDADDLLIFVSTTMPAASIKTLIRQAQAAHGVVVLRGLVKNSFKETKAFFNAHADPNHAPPIVIDPTQFKRYGIAQVPAFVITNAACIDHEPACQETAPTWSAAFGDVGLDYALEHLARHHVLGARAAHHLAELKESP